ncbi:MAG: prepilin-type N-terminal cleavage/methylation domain-containing protein [Candidatus Riflebacteria bacterium]
MKRSAFTLVEVLVAAVIFVIAAVPIYYAIAGGAGRGIETSKLSMARKILESFREEIMSKTYEEIKPMVPAGADFGKLDGGYPKTLTDVLEFQRQFKDFDFQPKARFNPTRNTVIEFMASVTWTRADGSKHPEEKLAFVMVGKHAP